MKTSLWLITSMIGAAIILGVSISYAQGDELHVNVIYAGQTSSPGIISVFYSLETVGDIPATVSLYLSTDGGESYPYLCQSVTGDVGPGVLPGTGRYIVWNAGLDIPGVISDNFRLRVTADDGVAVGTVVVDPNPDELVASWTLTGPNSFSLAGAGDETLPDLVAGQYTLEWGPVAGWFSPPASTQTLVDEMTITFGGFYVEEGFVLIPPGTFQMGSPTDELGRDTDETLHTVNLTRGFYMARTEVTSGQYVAALQWAYDQGHVTVTTENVFDKLDGSTKILLQLGPVDIWHIIFSDGVFSTPRPNRPVNWVSWFGSVAYCDWLSLQEGLPRAYDHSTWSCNSDNPYTASGYRLPTEAEWEFACRAGTTTPFNTGDCLDSGTEATFRGSPYFGCPEGPNIDDTTDVASFPANQWGLFDMHGNLWEWCNDWYGFYNGDETDPIGPELGGIRLLRGGSWTYDAVACRSAMRGYRYPVQCYNNNGFRPVKTAF
jgi:formylglycine-generating enzyme required for sulfatase activity